MFYTSVTQLIGKTPLMRLVGYERFAGLKARIFAKLEYLNPAGSVKDRTAYAMILRAAGEGLLKVGGTVIEPTSGNTGIAVAAVCAAMGYNAVIVMPANMSVERRKMIEAYGAQVILTTPERGMSGAVEYAARLSAKTGGIVLGQFENSANPEIHYRTTGAEIYEDTEGKIDYFVAGVGSGGTLSGAGVYLKRRISGIKAVAVEPSGSPVLSRGLSGSHAIQGIGAGFVPKVLNTSVYDEVIAVNDGEALTAMKNLCKAQGLFVGLSSGAAVRACEILASRPENHGKNIVAVFPDSGDRYLSII